MRRSTELYTGHRAPSNVLLSARGKIIGNEVPARQCAATRCPVAANKRGVEKQSASLPATAIRRHEVAPRANVHERA